MISLQINLISLAWLSRLGSNYDGIFPPSRSIEGDMRSCKFTCTPKFHQFPEWIWFELLTSISGNDSWNTETGHLSRNKWFSCCTATVRTSHQREKWSTHVSKYVYPSQAGKRPIMPMYTCSNRSFRDGKGLVSVRVCQPTQAFCYCTQVLTNILHMRLYVSLHD